MNENLGTLVLTALVTIVIAYSVVFVLKKPMASFVLFLLKNLGAQKISDKCITLPPADEIMRRFKEIETGDDHMEKRFYPLIAAEGGRELVAQGVVMMLTLKIYDFVQSGYPPIIEHLLHMRIPQFIDVLVDDPDVRKAAKKFHSEAMEAAKAKKVG